MAYLDIKQVTKSFGGLIAVNNVDFSMGEKQIASIIGPNGAGKSTLFNMISGYYKNEGGSIEFDGESLVNLNPEKISQHRIGRTFQNIRLFQEMLAVENVLIGIHQNLNSNLFDILLRTKKMKKEESNAYIEALELLKYVGLEDKGNTLAKNLSYGEQRHLEIARALAIKPKLLMLDEPAAGMNPKETEDLTEFIKKIRDDLGLTILFIEHDMKVVMNISDKISVMNYGKKIAEGTPYEIKNNKLVIEAYLGKEEEY